MIKEPIWSTKSVGINIGGLSDQSEIEVKIMYKDKHDNFVYPGRFRMTVEDIRKYPTQNMWGYVWVHIVPIAVLQQHVVEED